MKLTDDDREKLREFETEDLLLAVDHLDEMRGELGDDGIRPPPIRMKLLELHQIAFDVIKRGHQFPDGIIRKLQRRGYKRSLAGFKRQNEFFVLCFI